MKLKSGMKLNHVCGENFVVPMGEENIDFSKIIALNDSSLLLWQRMEKGEFTIEDLLETLLQEYEVDEATARKDIENLLEKLSAEGVLE